MIPVDDASEFDWIANNRTSVSGRASATSGVELSCVIPLQFERYTKILHRLDGHYENIDHPLSPKEIAILGLGCPSVREFVVQKRRTSPTSRISWKEAAVAFGVPFAPEINHGWFLKRLEPHQVCWSRFIYGPGEGTLDADGCRDLVSVLRSVTGEQECYFRLAEIPFVATDQKLLFTGTLNEVEDFFVRGPFQFTPEYWWPRDRSWCVCTDYDLNFTFVGGNSTLVKRLLRGPVLQCIEVSSGIRLDSLAPIPEDLPNR